VNTRRTHDQHGKEDEEGTKDTSIIIILHNFSGHHDHNFDSSRDDKCIVPRNLSN